MKTRQRCAAVLMVMVFAALAARPARADARLDGSFERELRGDRWAQALFYGCGALAVGVGTNGLIAGSGGSQRFERFSLGFFSAIIAIGVGSVVLGGLETRDARAKIREHRAAALTWAPVVARTYGGLEARLVW